MLNLHRPEAEPEPQLDAGKDSAAKKCVADEVASPLPRILEVLAGLTQPCRVPTNEWRLLRPSQRVRRFPGSSRELLDKLAAEISAEDLIAARLAVRDDQGDLLPTQRLSAASPEFLLLTRGKDLPPHDAVTLTGSLASHRPPVLDALDDYSNQLAGAQWPDILLVAFDFANLGVMRSIGMPATMAAGLATITASHLGELCQTSTPGSATLAKIVLAGWNIATFSPQPAPELAQVTKHLAGAAEHFEFDLEKLAVWQPSAREIEAIRVAARLRCANYIGDSIRESLEHAKYIGAYERARREPPPGDYPAAREQLRRALEPDRIFGSDNQVQSRLAAYELAYRQHVVGPLERELGGTSDALAKPLLVQAIDLAQELYHSDRLVVAARAKIAGGSGRIEPMRREEIDDQRNLSNTYLAIRRQLRTGD